VRLGCCRGDRWHYGDPVIDFSSPSVFKLNPCDRDAELDLWFSGLGKVRLEFKANSDIRRLGQMIAGYVL
jgi:hypothetical protein